MAPGPGDTVEIGLSQGTALPPHKAGKEVRKGEVFYSWGKEGQNTQSCMASALTRGGWGGLWDRGEGSDCAWVGTEPPSPGQRGFAGEWAKEKKQQNAPPLPVPTLFL